MKLAIFIFMIFSLALMSYRCKSQQFSLKNVDSELSHFIDTVKPMTIKRGMYNVYILKVVDSCISINFVCNDFELNYISQKKYYFVRNGEYVILIANEDQIKPFKDYFKSELLTDSSYRLISQKLLSKKTGFITGVYKGVLLCSSSGIVTKDFFKNAENMPKKMWAFDRMPQDITIEKLDPPNKRKK
jgi:hypothetical protein